MRTILWLILSIILCINQVVLAQYSVNGNQELFNSTVDGLKSPDTEHRAALLHLKYKVFREDRPFIKYFTLYAVPKERQEPTLHILNIWIHSLIDSVNGGKKYSLVKSVTDTLYYIDIRDYGWLNETWDIVAQEDPYIQQPWINDEDVNEIENILLNNIFAKEGNFISANILLRADWFIYHLSDVSAQDDLGREPLYYVLPYSTLGEPQNLDDFRNAWQVDVKVIEDLALERGALVESGKSAVSLHNRQISVARTPFGYYYETSDTRTGVNEFNYLDNLQPFGLGHVNRDASEQITVNGLGLQVYFLTDGVGNRVEFADPSIVRDMAQLHDVRVKNGRSCITCHAKGLNNVENYFRQVLRAGVTIRSADKKFRDLIEHYFMHDFNARIASDKHIYSLAIQRLSGWQPEEFTNNYNNFMLWYEQPIDLIQAALETGVSVEIYRENTKSTPNGTLAQLVTGGTISRRVWEETDAAPFIESMLLLYRSHIVFSAGQQLELEELFNKVDKSSLQVNPRSRTWKNTSIISNIKAKDPEIKARPNTQLDEIVKTEDEKPKSPKLFHVKSSNSTLETLVGEVVRDCAVVTQAGYTIRTLKMGETVYIYKEGNNNLLKIYYYPQPTFDTPKIPVRRGYVQDDCVIRRLY